MLLGLTYAQFVAALMTSMVAFESPENPSSADRVHVSFDHVYKDNRAFVDNSSVSLEWRPNTHWRLGLQPVYALGADSSRAIYASMGARKDFRWQEWQVTPFLGPALYQSKSGQFNAKELLQFRSGLDVSYHFSPNTAVGFGVYHISNAQITPESADKDARRITFQFRY